MIGIVEKISELEHTAVETILKKTPRKKRLGGNKWTSIHLFSELWDNLKWPKLEINPTHNT